MRYFLASIFLSFLLLSKAQNFGCFSEPTDFEGRHFYRQPIQRDIDSALWKNYIKYQLPPNTPDGYFKSKWNKYQDKMEGFVVNGKKNGVWKLHFQNNQQFYVGAYKDDLKQGVWKCFEVINTDTVLQHQFTFKNDLLDGCYNKYVNDSILSEYKFIDNKLISYNLYSLYDKKYIRMSFNQLDSLSSIEIQYSLTEQKNVLISEITKKDKDKEEEIRYSDTGDTLVWRLLKNKKTIIDIHLLREESKSFFINKNGIIKSVKFAENGDTLLICNIEKENVYYKVFLYDSLTCNWKVDREYNNKDGLLDGSFKKYYSNGQLMYEIIFKNGMLFDAVNFYSKEGENLDFGTLKQGNGSLKMYYQDGKPYSVFNYKDGKINEAVDVFTPSGDTFTHAVFFGKSSNLYYSSQFNLFAENSLLDNICFNRFYSATDYGNVTQYYEDKSIYYVKKYDTLTHLTNVLAFDKNRDTTFICSKYSFPESNLLKFNYYFCGYYYHKTKNINDVSICQVVGKYIYKDGISLKDSTWTYLKNDKLVAKVAYKAGEKEGISKYYDSDEKLRRLEINDPKGSNYSIFDGDTINLIDKNGFRQKKWLNFYRNDSFGGELGCSDQPNRFQYFINDTLIYDSLVQSFFYGRGYNCNNQGCYVKIVLKDSATYRYSQYCDNVLIEEGDVIIEDDIHKNNNSFRFGLWREYDCRKGYLRAEGEYYLNQKVGKWKTFKKNGKLLKMINCDKEQIYYLF
jgi:antitoxin component YwqK of YwqJK toxin-antitoxin module